MCFTVSCCNTEATLQVMVYHNTCNVASFARRHSVNVLLGILLQPRARSGLGREEDDHTGCKAVVRRKSGYFISLRRIMSF